MAHVTVTELARHFADYVNRVAYRRESFTLVRGKKPLAELRPLPVGVRVSELPALIRSLPRLTEAEAADFAADLAAVHDELANVEVHDAWQS
jgi:antitoxin (DNA-binding transcriptional repressor) of toxin-antitoxin stability system